MWPTSIAVWKRSAPPHSGQRSPSVGCADVGEARLEVAAVPRRRAGASRSRFAPATNWPSRERLVGDHLAVEADRAERAAARRRTRRGSRPRSTGRTSVADGREQLRLARAGRRRGRARARRAVVLRHRHRLRRRGLRRSRAARRAPRSSSRPASRPPRARRARGGNSGARGTPRATSRSAA